MVLVVVIFFGVSIRCKRKEGYIKSKVIILYILLNLNFGSQGSSF